MPAETGALNVKTWVLGPKGVNRWLILKLMPEILILASKLSRKSSSNSSAKTKTELEYIQRKPRQFTKVPPPDYPSGFQSQIDLSDYYNHAELHSKLPRRSKTGKHFIRIIIHFSYNCCTSFLA